MAVSEFPLHKELEKNIEIQEKVIRDIRSWLTEQPHLPHEHISDLDIALALHSCNCNSEQTKKVIDLNFTLRTIFAFYQHREINNDLENSFRTWLMVPLDTRTKLGYKAIYCHLLDADPAKFVYNDVVRAFVMMLDLWQYEEGTTPGVVIIVDMDRVSLGHLSRIDLNVAQQFFYFLQEAMFVRLKGFHFINAPSFIDGLLSMVRPFMKKEMLDLVKVHKMGSYTLEEHLSMAALPKDAGGQNEECTKLRDETWKKIKANKCFFEMESKKRVDESKRPGEPKSISSFFSGLETTFKKLNID